MKKIIVIIILLLFLTSCTITDNNEPNDINGKAQYSSISSREYYRIADSHLDNILTIKGSILKDALDSY